MTADAPRKRSQRDHQIDKIRDLVRVRVGVLGPTHRRWPALCRAARRLGCRPEDAIWRIRHGRWSNDSDSYLRHIQTTLADVIREEATR